MSLNTLLGKALDQLFLDIPQAAQFSKQKSTGPHLRRFLLATEFAQREIVFYRDKHWSASGGTLYAEIICLVHAVQLAVHGEAQSLLAPDYNVPFSHFQYTLSEHAPRRSWELHSAEDVAAFEREMRDWLPLIALPWLAQFETNNGVIGFMQANHQFLKAALFLASLGDGHGASQAVSAWIEGLPRRIENNLRKLAASGLISSADEAYLASASIQSEEDYRQRIAVWRASILEAAGRPSHL